MHSKLLNFISVFTVILFGLFFGLPAQALKLGLSINPQIFEMDVFPGETISQKITIGNLSEVSLPIIVRVVDFTAEEDSGEMIFDEASQDPSVASRKWFKIENPDLILEPGERKKVLFSINVPENAEPRGYYSVMIFEPRLPSFYFEETGEATGEVIPVQPRAIPVVGVLFLTSIKTFALEPEVKEKLEVVEFSLPKEERIKTLEVAFSGVQRTYQRLSASISPVYAAETSEIEITKKAPSSFILRIKNNDIYHIKPYGKVLIYNFFGKKVGEAEIPQRTILPGQIRKFPVEFSPEIPEKLKWLPASVSNFLVQNFFVGKYGARIELQTKSPLTAEVFQPEIPVVLTFFSLPWHFWLTFILIFAMIIFFSIKYRKRIVLAMKTLLSPNPFFKIGQ